MALDILRDKFSPFWMGHGTPIPRTARGRAAPFLAEIDFCHRIIGLECRELARVRSGRGGNRCAQCAWPARWLPGKTHTAIYILIHTMACASVPKPERWGLLGVWCRQSQGKGRACGTT